MANEITITETINEVTVDETTLEVTVDTTINEFTIVTTGAIVPTKAEIGLDQVDNTSDANKPISTATQTALNLKADKANPQLSGTMTLANAFTISGDFDTAANRPKFQSNTGDVTGIKILPPNNNSTNESRFQFHSKNSSSDAEVLVIGAKNSATNPTRLGLGELVNGTMQDTTKPLTILGLGTGTVYATIPAGTTPSVSSDLTRKDYVDTVAAGLISETNPQMSGTASLSDGFTFAWSENNDRTARLNFQSTDGSQTGIRVLTPSTAASGQAIASISVFNNDDLNNGDFLNLQSRDSASDRFRILTGTFTSGTQAASGLSLNFYDYTTKYASVNPSGPTVSTDLTTKSYVDALVAGKDNTDEITEGTTNLYFTNERVDDRINDLLVAGTGISKTYNDAGNSLTIAVSSGNVRVGITGTNEITTTTGNLNIDSAGGTVTVDDNLTVTGNLTVSGTTTTVNTETILLADNIIVLNSNATGAASENAGIEIERGSDTNVQIRWNESTDKWQQTRDGSTYYDIPISTTELTEGTNLYYTQGRFDTAFSNKETDDLAEGTTNLYFTNARAQSAIANTTPTLAGVTAGNITVGITTDNTITTSTGNLTINSTGGDALFDANIIAKGQLTTYDNFVVLNSDVSGAPSENGGIVVNRGTSSDVSVRFNETTDRWGSTVDGSTYIEFPNQSLDTDSSAQFASINLDNRVILDTATLTTSATTADQILDSNSATTYRSAKYQVQITSGTDYQVVEILLIHDGTTASIVTYADVKTGSTDLANFDADISSGNIRLLTTPTNAITTYKVTKTLIVV